MVGNVSRIQIYLTVHKWLVGDVQFYLKFWAKVTHPFKNGDFKSIFACSASTIASGEKKFNCHL